MQGEIETLRWWQTRWFVAVAILAVMIPLLPHAVPPLLDVPGHIGRYRIMVEAGQGPLARHFAFHRAIIGNLGVDLLVYALHPLLDVEPATRLVTTLIPALAVAALLWAGYEAHGHVPPAAAFAFPLAYGFPFQLGFVNFTLAAALAIAGLAWWIRLARTRAAWVRVAVMVPVACVIWVCHSFGWAMLGLFVLGAEWAIRRATGEPRWRASLWAGLFAAPLALPQLLASLAARDRLTGATGDFLNWEMKGEWLASLLRERWQNYDIAGVAILAFVLFIALRSKSLRFAPVLALPALLGFAAFIALPRFYAGGAYVDMRMLPYATALALVAIDLRQPSAAIGGWLAAAGTAFCTMRLATTTVALALFAHSQTAELKALPSLPVGAAVLVLVDEPSGRSWTSPRFTHIAQLATARRRVFTNGQWALKGQQLVEPLHPAAAPLDRNPSQVVYRTPDAIAQTEFDPAIATFDRGTFDYVWTIGFPAGRAHARDLALVWHNGASAVYRVIKGPRMPHARQFPA